jgi:hypothetical protein
MAPPNFSHKEEYHIYLMHNALVYEFSSYVSNLSILNERMSHLESFYVTLDARKKYQNMHMIIVLKVVRQWDIYRVCV